MTNFDVLQNRNESLTNIIAQSATDICTVIAATVTGVVFVYELRMSTSALEVSVTFTNIYCSCLASLVSYCHLSYTVTCHILSPVIYCHLSYTVTCLILSPVIYCHLSYTVTRLILSLVSYCHLSQTVTCLMLSLIIDCHLCPTATCLTLILVLYCHLPYTVT